jgi:hypothetical protein
MITCYKTHFRVLGMAIIFAVNTSKAQTNIPVNTIVTQDFNSMTTGLTLPASWRVSAAGAGLTSTWATGVTTVTQAANSGNPATGGAYNWGTTAGIDRAVGFMASGSYATPNAVMAFYRNTTGATVTTLTISFMVERYKANTSNANLSFFSSTDGAAWTPRTAGDIPAGIFATGTAAFTFSQPRSFFRTVTITGLNIPNNGDVYFRWVFNDATAATAQGLGLDNVSIYAGTATPVILAQLRDSLSFDNVLPNQANPDDQLRYTTKIKNTGSGDANSVVLTQPAPTNTTLVPGSVKTSALARDESYTTGLNTPLNIAAPGVLTNDYGIPSPAVASFGPTANSSAYAAGAAGLSDNGGALTVNTNGSFTYTPPSPTFAGIDKFSYKASNGNAPDNDAIVIITVGTPPSATNDAYNVVGNIRINPTGTQNLLNNDGGGGLSVTAVNGSAANVGAMFTTANGSNITVYANGDFVYNPGPGFDGPESFTYTVDNGFGAPQTATVNITISGMVWFIANGGAAGDGRLTAPFNSIGAFQALNNGTGNNPNNNDNIFIYESATSYVGSVALALRTGQRLIGQDATTALSAITGLTPAAYSDPFPVMDATAGQTTTLTTTVAATNAITLGSGNTIRGLTVGNTTGAKIFGNAFGTVTIGDNTSPDVTLNGTGQALNLTTGTFAATTGFVSVVSTNSGSQGITLAAVTGTASFGSTTISGSTTQGILVGTTTANINFGNTSVTGGTDGVSLQNNSAGTRTFGTLNITSTGANTSFLHAVGGGATVAGVTTISNGAGAGIDIQNSATAVSFGATTITKSGAGTAVNINGTNGNVTFAGVTLGTSGTRLTDAAVVITGGTGTYNFGTTSIFTNGVTAFSATNADGTINTTSGTIDATGGSAIVISGPAGLTTLGMTLTTVNSNGGTNNVSFVNCGGTATLNGGTLTGTAAGATFNVNGGTVGITYNGGITQAANAVMVNIIGGHSTGAITFQTGTLSATNGTGLQFDNADGVYNFNGTTTLNGGNAGIDILNGSTGTFSFSANTSITNPSGTAFNLTGATASNANVTYSGNISTNTVLAVNIDNHDAGTITFQTGNITGTVQGISVMNCAAGTVNFNNPTISLTTGGNTAVNLATNTSSAINFASAAGGNGLDISTSTGTGFNATGGGTITVTGTGNTITKSSTGTAININSTNAGAGGINFASVNVTGGAGQAINITTSTGTKSLGDVDVARGGGGTGIFATAAGTLNTTTGSINSGNQVAIDIDNTVLGMVLERVDVNGAATGIDLNTTTGSFTINGTGTTNGSGGTIQNISQRGVQLISASNITLKNIQLTNANLNDAAAPIVDLGSASEEPAFPSASAANGAIYLSAVLTVALDNIDISGTIAQMGITGVNVSNFTMNNSTITNAGDGSFVAGGGIFEDAIRMANLSGICSITNSTFTFSETNTMDVFNRDVNLTLTIDNCSFNDTQTISSGGATNGNGEGGFQFRSFSSAAGVPVSNIRIKNSNFLRIRTQAIQTFASSDCILNIDITNNTINSQTDIGAGIDINGDQNSQVNFNVIGNPLIASRGGAAVNITAFLDANVMGRVNDNTNINPNGTGAGGSGVRAVAQETSSIIIEVKNNNITMAAGNNSTPIDMQARFQSARLDAIIDNNNLSSDPAAVADINIVAGSSLAGETNQVYVYFHHNDVIAAGPTNKIRLRVSDLDATTNPLMFLQGFIDGGSGIEDDAVATWNGNLNTPVVTTATVAVSLTGTATGPASGTALAPTNPFPI